MEAPVLEIIVVIAIVLALIIAIVLVLAANRPRSFRVERSAVIQAPPERIYALIEDFHRWVAWSPWEGRDPDLRRSFAGTERGKGAVYAWEGNKQVGSGRMEIIDATTPSKLVIKLDFLKPFEAHNTAEFTIMPQSGGSGVHWVMHGPAPLMFRVMQLFMSMDKMVGKDFETGLANLRKAAEQT
jgi:uncharacterized protein YndB with AHSA1/START domain